MGGGWSGGRSNGGRNCLRGYYWSGKGSRESSEYCRLPFCSNTVATDGRFCARGINLNGLDGLVAHRAELGGSRFQWNGRLFGLC